MIDPNQISFSFDLTPAGNTRMTADLHFQAVVCFAEDCNVVQIEQAQDRIRHQTMRKFYGDVHDDLLHIESYMANLGRVLGPDFVLAKALQEIRKLRMRLDPDLTRLSAATLLGLSPP